MDRSPIVTRINTLLAKKNISKAEFYEKCNLTSASYSNWNTGKTRPKMKNIERIARFLGVTSEYLLYGDSAEKEETPDPKIEGEDAQLAQFIAKFSRLSPQQKSAVLAVMEGYQPSQE